MSTNPFSNNKVETLKEAFPNVAYERIEQVLLSENGDVEKAIDRLLEDNQQPQPRKQPQQHMPHIKPSLSIKKNLQNIKATRQSVREELAQWRQELLHQNEQRRTNIKHLKRDMNKCYDCQSRSNSSTQNRNEYYYNEGYMRDIINESSSAALKAVNSVYNIVSNSVNSYLTTFEPSTSSSSSNNVNNTFSNSSSSYNSPYNQTNMNLNTQQRPNELRSTQSHNSLPAQQQRQQRPSELRTTQSHTTIPLQPLAPSSLQNNNNLNISRNDQINSSNNNINSDTTMMNPFTSTDHTSDADPLAPPPTYEQSEHDRLVPPTLTASIHH